MAIEYWNIPDGLIAVFYVLAVLTIAIFFLGFWNKIRIWGKGMDVDEELRGMGPVRLFWLSIIKFFSSDSLFAKRVFRRSSLRGFMLMAIIWSFAILFIGTVGRSTNYWIFKFLSGHIWLVFSLILDIAGVLILIGTGFYLIRKYTIKTEKKVKTTQDLILLLLLFFAIFTGFFLEGIRIAVLNPPSADWSPVGLVFGVTMKAIIGVELLNSLHISVWVIHFLLAFSFIAYIPFSKYTHIFASQITTYLFENKWKEKKIPRNWVFQEDIAERMNERLRTDE